MFPILNILQAISSVYGAATGTVSAAQCVVNYLRRRARDAKAAEVLQFLHDLGCATDADVRQVVDNWDAPAAVSPDVREELVGLLTNLVRGARFHNTQGTPLSSYLRCERLIEQLIQNLQPKHRTGDKLIGGWVLRQFLGMGSFGEVWVGRHDRYPEPRAFKFFTQPGAKEWFEKEGSALFAVQKELKNCPNVIKYIDVADADPHPYLVLEYVDGGSLEDWILSPAAERRSIDVVEVVEGVVRGLAAAHAHGICHRDLKPANVLLTGGSDAVPKIADFGLSRVDAPAGVGSAAVSQAVMVGTRMYLPPEAADPYEARPPAQDDVFAIGVIWYQLLTGKLERPPYDFADRLTSAGTDSRTVRLVSRCLAHPDRRYRGGGELLAELDAESADASWAVPEGCFDVGPIAREYVERAVR